MGDIMALARTPPYLPTGDESYRKWIFLDRRYVGHLGYYANFVTDNRDQTARDPMGANIISYIKFQMATLNLTCDDM